MHVSITISHVNGSNIILQCIIIEEQPNQLKGE